MRTANDNVRSADALVDFYEGANGSTLRIDLPTEKALNWLRDRVSDLANGKASSVRLSEMPNSYFSQSVREVMLLRVPSNLRRQEHPVRQIVEREFSWSQPDEGWAWTLGLLSGLSSGGRQRLTERDVAIECSLRENAGVEDAVA